MANKPLKSIKFPGLNDTYTVPEVDATLAVTGAAADAKKVGDEISDLKADLSEISEVHGSKTVDVYEYTPVELNLGAGSWTNNGVVFTQNNDGTISAVGTNTYTSGIIFGIRSSSAELAIPLTAGEKYRLTGCPAGGAASGGYSLTIRLASGGGPIARDIGEGVIINMTETTTYKIHITVAQGLTINKVFTPKLEKMTVVGQETVDALTAKDDVARDDIASLTADIEEVKDLLTPEEETITVNVSDGLLTTSEWTKANLSSDSNYWVSNKKYPNYRIDSVDVKILSGTATVNVAVLKEKSNTVLEIIYLSESVTGSGVVNVPMNYTPGVEFYIAIKGNGAAFADFNNIIKPGLYSGNIYNSQAKLGGTVNIPNNNQYYHAYTVNMSYEEKKEHYGILTAKDTITYSKETIAGTSKYPTVLDLPTNKIYKINSNIAKTFGLPTVQDGSLLKYIPDESTNNTERNNTYVFSERVNSYGDSNFYFSKDFPDLSVSEMNWIKVGTHTKGIVNIGLEPKIIGFIGDSIVEGYGSSDYNGGASGTSGHRINNNVKTWYRNTGVKCWTNKMINHLTASYSGITAFNNGIGGFTSKNIYDNLETLTLDDSGNRANVIVLSVGTNNVYDDDMKTTITQWIIKTIHWLKYRHIQPVILTNTPLIDRPIGKNDKAVQSAIINACNQTGVYCYDLLSKIYRYMWEHEIPLEYASNQSKFMHDVLHPADSCYEVMFELIKEMLCV